MKSVELKPTSVSKTSCLFIVVGKFRRDNQSDGINSKTSCLFVDVEKSLAWKAGTNCIF
jgi:hypothetical protein